MIKIFVLCLALAVAHAGIYGGTIVGPSSPGVVIHGPSAKGSVTGPDGSHISAIIPGATVIAHPRHGGAVSGAVVPGHIVGGHGHWGGWDGAWGGHGVWGGHWIAFLAAVLASALAAPSKVWPYSINPGVGTIYKGPSSEIIIEGPDGSVITYEQEGGAIEIKDDVAPAISIASVGVGHGALVYVGHGGLADGGYIAARGPGLEAYAGVNDLVANHGIGVGHGLLGAGFVDRGHGAVLTGANGAVVATGGHGPAIVASGGHGPAVIATGPSSPAVISTVGHGPAVIASGGIIGGYGADGHGILTGPGLIATGGHGSGVIATGGHGGGVIVTGGLLTGEILTGGGHGGVIAAGAPGLDGGVVTSVTHEVSGPSLVSAGPVVALHDNPIIVEDIAVVKDPTIVEEHVLVGDKIITVPKKLEENTDLIGPSGTISTRGDDTVISGTSSITIKGGGVVSSIEKQDDIHVKTIEVKPVVAPVVVKPIAPVLDVVAQPIYAAAANNLGVGNVSLHPVLSHRPGIIRTGPVLAGPLVRPDLELHPNFLPSHGHGLQPYYRPLYKGSIHR